jgi:hypothetical protein
LLQIAKTQNLINVASNQTQRLTIVALNRKRKHSHCYKSQTQSFATTIANKKNIKPCKHRASLSLFQIANIEPHCYYSKSQSHYLTIVLLKITQAQNNLTIITKGNTR